MTARHQIRFGSRRVGHERPVIDATPAPGVGEMLYAARERKGVDLYRAERDTKIRLKYLEAMEDGAYDELPPPVYTKGFLRNYALYLGLPPDEVIARWREEALSERKTDKVVVAPPPRPLTVPRRGLSITPGMLVGLMLSAAVLAFLGYIGWQVLRFADAPGVAMTYPAQLVSQINAEEITLAGTAGPSARVTVQAASGQTYTTVAGQDGSWSRSVPLSKGRNDFSITARDPVTERDSTPLAIIITVPLPGESPSQSPSATLSVIGMTLTSPLSGTTSADGSITISGSTTGTRITVSAQPLGTATPAPSSPASPSPAASPSSSPSGFVPLDISLPGGGAFSETINLEPGTWSVVITSYATGLTPRVETRTVTVAPEAIGDGAMTLVITADGGGSWMRIVADGSVLPGRQWGGPTLRNGQSVTVTADQEIYIRSGNAGVLRITLNGVDLGMLGNRGQVGNWIFEPGEQPRQTTESR